MLATNHNRPEKEWAIEVEELLTYIGEKFDRYMSIETHDGYMIAREYTSILMHTSSWTGELFYFSNFHDMYIFLLGYYSGLKTR